MNTPILLHEVVWAIPHMFEDYNWLIGLVILALGVLVWRIRDYGKD